MLPSPPVIVADSQSSYPWLHHAGCAIPSIAARGWGSVLGARALRCVGAEKVVNGERSLAGGDDWHAPLPI
ncbi:hypothetical protein PSPO01_02461 [Paraphaeosphaeria sporulosa]